MTPEQVDAFVATLPATLDPDVRADVVSIVAYLKDPVIGLYVERTLRAAIDAGSWQAMLDALEPKTAEDFKALDKDALGHGSYKRGERGEFLLDHKDALANITAGKPATIAKEQLRDVLKLAEKRGGTPDLVKLTLEGTPLFAGGLNIARKDMPQISRDERPNLLASLKAQGVAVTKEQVAPMSLLPTQKEINASRVGGMLTKFESHNKPLTDILISKDNRVLDGHHRWALGVMLQTEAPGVKMRAIRIGVDHAKALSLLNTYTKEHHIAPQALEVRVAGGAGSGNFGHTGGEGGPGNPGGSGAAGSHEANQVEDSLKSTPISISTGDALGGNHVNPAWHIETTSGEEGLFKPEEGETRYRENSIDWNNPNAATLAEREVLAADIGHALGMSDIVPPAHMVEIEKPPVLPVPVTPFELTPPASQTPALEHTGVIATTVGGLNAKQ